MQVFYQYKENTMRMTLHGARLSYIPHFHPSLELVYVRRGHSTALAGKQEYRLEPDDLFIAFPHQIHGYRDDDADLDRTLMFIPLNYIPAFKDQLCTALPACPVLHGASQYPRLIELFEAIHEARYAGIPNAAEILSGYLTAFIGLLLPRLDLRPVAGQEFSTLHTILRYCADHYREPLTITRIADELHIHRNYVSSVFSQRLHISFNDYLNSLRIEDARKLLRTTNDTVTAISAAVGFETIRTFNRAFQRVCGMTPSDYREQKQKNT